MVDLNFPKILAEMRLFHKDFPTLSFGHIIQVAIDREKLTPNFDLNNMSSKQLLCYLKKYREYLKKTKKRKEEEQTIIKRNEASTLTHEEIIGGNNGKRT